MSGYILIAILIIIILVWLDKMRVVGIINSKIKDLYIDGIVHKRDIIENPNGTFRLSLDTVGDIQKVVLQRIPKKIPLDKSLTHKKIHIVRFSKPKTSWNAFYISEFAVYSEGYLLNKNMVSVIKYCENISEQSIWVVFSEPIDINRVVVKSQTNILKDASLTMLDDNFNVLYSYKFDKKIT